MKSHEKFYLPWLVALRNVEFLFENCDDLHNSLKIVVKYFFFVIFNKKSLSSLNIFLRIMYVIQ